MSQGARGFNGDSFFVSREDLTRPAQPKLLAGNFWPNATFEEGENLDQPDGTVNGWSRGGSDPDIDQVSAENFVSPGHALIVNDQNQEAFSEWFSDLPLEGKASAGDLLQLQWFEIYSVSEAPLLCETSR